MMTGENWKLPTLASHHHPLHRHHHPHHPRPPRQTRALAGRPRPPATLTPAGAAVRGASLSLVRRCGARDRGTTSSPTSPRSTAPSLTSMIEATSTAAPTRDLETTMENNE